MKSRPILFSAPMIRALMDGRKTQTRRIVAKKFQPFADEKIDTCHWNKEGWATWKCDEHGRSWCTCRPIPCPYGQPGDLLWCRETWQGFHQTSYEYDEWEEMKSPKDRHDQFYVPVYRADNKNFPDRWFPAIHMPQQYSRLTLQITDIRAERLQDISDSAAMAEGWDENEPLQIHPYGWFRNLWKSINGPESWDANPFVWALTFTVHHQNVEEFMKARAA